MVSSLNKAVFCRSRSLDPGYRTYVRVSIIKDKDRIVKVEFSQFEKRYAYDLEGYDFAMDEPFERVNNNGSSEEDHVYVKSENRDHWSLASKGSIISLKEPPVKMPERIFFRRSMVMGPRISPGTPISFRPTYMETNVSKGCIPI